MVDIVIKHGAELDVVNNYDQSVAELAKDKTVYRQILESNKIDPEGYVDVSLIAYLDYIRDNKDKKDQKSNTL